MTRRLLLGAVAVALGGCDVVFGLDRSQDAAVDVARPDVATGCRPEEHDEDGDGLPDRCDTCPYVIDNGGDADEDGVGDACDPEPEGENHQLAFFGFDSVPTDLKLLAEGSGNWMIDHDRLVITGAIDGDYLARLDVSRLAVIVQTHVTFTSSQTTVGSRSAGLWARIDAGSTHPAFPNGTVFEQVDVSAKQFAHIVEVGTNNSGVTDSAPYYFESGRSYLLTLHCTTVNAGCSGVGLTDGHPAYSAEIQNGTGRAGAIGLRVHGDMTAAFDWLAVYSERSDPTP